MYKNIFKKHAAPTDLLTRLLIQIYTYLSRAPHANRFIFKTYTFVKTYLFQNTSIF